MKGKLKGLATKFLAVVSALMALTVSAFAETSDAVASMSTGIAGIKDDIVSGIGAVAPYALAIVGLFLLWRYGMRFFKSVSK